MKKIQFGCGNTFLNGWENTDLPNTDVRKKLQYENNSTDFIFHEHMIEHLDEVDGYKFMKECFRILKVGGVMRVSCPSIDGFIYVYQNWDKVMSEIREKKLPPNKYSPLYRNRTSYINSVTFKEVANYSGKFFTNDDYECITTTDDDHYLNILSIKNGDDVHKYYYDKEDFLRKLKKIGFSEITFVRKRESIYPELQNLEGRVGGIFDTFPVENEIILEAKK